jgi:hypothetical protein
LDYCLGDLFKTLGLQMMCHPRCRFEQSGAVWTGNDSRIVHGGGHMLVVLARLKAHDHI